MILMIMDQRQTPEVYVKISDNYLGVLKTCLLNESNYFSGLKVMCLDVQGLKQQSRCKVASEVKETCLAKLHGC